MNRFTHFHSYFTTLMSDVWLWFTKLNQQEWFVLLGIVAVLGFLCMKGISQRGHV